MQPGATLPAERGRIDVGRDRRTTDDELVRRRSGVIDRVQRREDERVLGLEMVVVLGVALVLCGALARRYPIAPAILLVLVGVLIGFVPHLRQARLPPEVVLLVFLPALLF